MAKDKRIDNDRVIVDLAMLKLSDKLAELEELSKYSSQLTKQVLQLTMDWAAALTPVMDCGWQGDLMVHSTTCTCGDDYDEWSDNENFN